MGVFFISEMGGNDIFSKAVWGGYFFEQSKSRDPAHVMINLGSHTPSQCIHQIISNAPATPDTQKNSHPKLLRHTIEYYTIFRRIGFSFCHLYSVTSKRVPWKVCCFMHLGYWFPHNDSQCLHLVF